MAAATMSLLRPSSTPHRVTGPTYTFRKSPRPAPPQLDGNEDGEESGIYVMNFLVPNKMVGAVIGLQGQAIKEMTRTSGARISVLNKDALGSSRTERIVEVEGALPKVSAAFKLIQEKIEADAETQGVAPSEEDQTRVPLKLLVANELIGHIIGKKGASIQQLINDSGTDITISQPESAHLGPGTIRVITVNGSLGAVCLAQSLICRKLHSILSDPETSPMRPPDSAAQLFGASAFPIIGGKSEKNIVYVLESMIGAIIGKGGVHAQEITRATKCKLHIETREEKADRDDSTKKDGEEDPRVADERQIIVMGPPNIQFMAQQMIYQLLVDDDQRQGNRRERRLKVHFAVPSSMLGRLIGKGGVKIKELAETSGARLKLIREEQQTEEEETFIEIFGSFAATQAAQNLIRQMTLEHRLRDLSRNR
eukprot:m.334196 g.334196  ORF g.334196 m.334196 type:complete len:424 (+) comp17309_c0_seq1:62-1333(+)